MEKPHQREEPNKQEDKEEYHKDISKCVDKDIFHLTSYLRQEDQDDNWAQKVAKVRVVGRNICVNQVNKTCQKDCNHNVESYFALAGDGLPSSFVPHKKDEEAKADDVEN